MSPVPVMYLALDSLLSHPGRSWCPRLQGLQWCAIPATSSDASSCQVILQVPWIVGIQGIPSLDYFVPDLKPRISPDKDALGRVLSSTVSCDTFSTASEV